MFSILPMLLNDKDDLVQKGYSWMLKAASEAYQQEVFDYVMSKKHYALLRFLLCYGKNARGTKAGSDEKVNPQNKK